MDSNTPNDLVFRLVSSPQMEGLDFSEITGMNEMGALQAVREVWQENKEMGGLGFLDPRGLLQRFASLANVISPHQETFRDIAISSQEENHDLSQLQEDFERSLTLAQIGATLEKLTEDQQKSPKGDLYNVGNSSIIVGVNPKQDLEFLYQNEDGSRDPYEPDQKELDLILECYKENFEKKEAAKFSAIEDPATKEQAEREISAAIESMPKDDNGNINATFGKTSVVLTQDRNIFAWQEDPESEQGGDWQSFEENPELFERVLDEIDDLQNNNPENTADKNLANQADKETDKQTNQADKETDKQTNQVDKETDNQANQASKEDSDQKALNSAKPSFVEMVQSRKNRSPSTRSAGG